MISLNLAISTAVMAMKLQLVTDAEIFCKNKVDTLLCHDETMLYVYWSTFHSKRNWKNAHNFVHMDTSMVPPVYNILDYDVQRLQPLQGQNIHTVVEEVAIL